MTPSDVRTLTLVPTPRQLVRGRHEYEASYPVGLRHDPVQTPPPPPPPPPGTAADGESINSRAQVALVWLESVRSAVTCLTCCGCIIPARHTALASPPTHITQTLWFMTLLPDT